MFTRSFALDRQTTIATESRTTSTTKHGIHTPLCFFKSVSEKYNTKQSDTGMNACKTGFFHVYCLLTTTYEWRSLTSGGKLYHTTLEAPGTQPLAMLLCGSTWLQNRNHYYLNFIQRRARLPRLIPCMYVRVFTNFDEQMRYYDFTTAPLEVITVV